MYFRVAIKRRCPKCEENQGIADESEREQIGFQKGQTTLKVNVSFPKHLTTLLHVKGRHDRLPVESKRNMRYLKLRSREFPCMFWLMTFSINISVSPKRKLFRQSVLQRKASNPTGNLVSKRVKHLLVGKCWIGAHWITHPTAFWVNLDILISQIERAEIKIREEKSWVAWRPYPSS